MSISDNSEEFITFVSVKIIKKGKSVMKATISLDGIWNFLQSLSLSASNKQWLGEKLLEEARKEKSEKSESYEDFIWSMCGAWKDDPRTTEEIMDDIRNSRQFGVTRHIRSFDDEKE